MPLRSGGGLSGDVAEATRGELAQKLREVTAEDPAIAAENLLSVQDIEETLLTTEADADALAHRILARRKKREDRFPVVAELNADTAAIDLGDTVHVVHTRYGLASLVGDDDDNGHPAVVVGIEPDAAGKTVMLTVVMSVGSMANLTMPNGDYLTMPNGDYLITPPR